MKKLLLSLFVISSMLLVSCGGASNSASSAVDAGGDSVAAGEMLGDTLIVLEREVPVYPGSEFFQDLMIQKSYLAPDSVEDVQSWYDQKMTAEGYGVYLDWNNFGGQMQKNYEMGEVEDKANYHQVMVGVSTNKDGRTMVVLGVVQVPKHVQ